METLPRSSSACFDRRRARPCSSATCDSVPTGPRPRFSAGTRRTTTTAIRRPAPSDTVEVFMRHRSVLMRADLASIPKGATILAAELVVTRALAADLKVPEKAHLWVAEPCNRDWDETSANCYFYAKGKHWKGV